MKLRFPTFRPLQFGVRNERVSFDLAWHNLREAVAPLPYRLFTQAVLPLIVAAMLLGLSIVKVLHVLSMSVVMVVVIPLGIRIIEEPVKEIQQ